MVMDTRLVPFPTFDKTLKGRQSFPTRYEQALLKSTELK